MKKIINTNKHIAKKISAILLSIIMCISLAACGGSRNNTTTTTETPTVRIMFQEGSTILDISKKLEEAGVCSAADFQKACNKIPEGYSNLICPKTNDNKVFLLEGYVFPDTYDFYIGEGADNALSRFLANTKSKITQEDFNRADELGMSMYEVFTLASIIQSEAGIDSEMANVSSVFHNRLAMATTGFPYIGSDVTRQYIEVKMKDYINNNGLNYNDLFAAYCTNDGYDLKTMGLPSGPICNPGISAIHAALYPSETSFLYFFTDPNGGFHYNTTLSQHQSQYNNLTNK